MIQPRNGLGPLLLVIILALFAGVIGGGIAGGTIASLVLREQGVTSSLPQLTKTQSRSQIIFEEQSAVIDVVEKVGAGVVTVVNIMTPSLNLLGETQQEKALGSGVIMDKSGYIVTNEHVVRNNQGLSVVLSSGEKRDAKLIGTDYPFTDLAVIKIDGDNLTVAKLGDSDSLIPGQMAVAIGSALGDFPNTVTRGIISGLHRSWSRNGIVMEDLIQTDAAINYGNSGGALVNSQGEVVGINTSVIRSTESGDVVEGIGFAIPSNTVRAIAEQLIEKGKVTRPYLGVVHRDITPSVASLYGLPVKYGAYVLSVRSGSPADKGGLRAYDIITKIGEDVIDGKHPFLNVLMRRRPNEETVVQVNRDGRQIQLTVILIERE